MKLIFQDLALSLTLFDLALTPKTPTPFCISWRRQENPIYCLRLEASKPYILLELVDVPAEEDTPTGNQTLVPHMLAQILGI